MRHGCKVNHLSRTHAHRVAMLSNMATSLIMEKRITTTVAKAKALRVYVEPLINRSKEDSGGHDDENHAEDGIASSDDLIDRKQCRKNVIKKNYHDPESLRENRGCKPGKQRGWRINEYRTGQ